MSTALRKPLLSNLAWVAALAGVFGVAYVLSYPLAVRVQSSAELPAYCLVDWLIDNTPAQEPMLWWADVWGVGEEVRVASLLREFSRPEFQEKLDEVILSPAIQSASPSF
jgi:hypothetical protein